MPTHTCDDASSTSSNSTNSDDEDSQKENKSPNKTEEDLTTSILYKLVKASKCAGLQHLKESHDLHKHCKLFNAWQSDLAIVTSTVYDTKHIFANWPKQIGTVPAYVNTALFNLISSHCEAGPKAHIRAHHGQGTKAITELQLHYAQTTSEIIDGAIAHYQTICQCPNETATSYMQHFDVAVDNCRQLGENFQHDNLLTQFMYGLDNKSKIYEARIEALCRSTHMAKLNPMLQPVTLQHIQSQLLAIDERHGLTSNNTIRHYNTGSPYAMPATAKYKTQKSPNKPKQNTICGYKPCGKPGHTTDQRCMKKHDDQNKRKPNNNK